MAEKTEIDWDGLTKGLQQIFKQAIENNSKGWGGADQAIEAAKALAQVSAEARASREAKERDTYKISKP